MACTAKSKQGFHYENCLRCHARIGMLGTVSAKAFGVDKATISMAKRKLGIKPITHSQATRATAFISGKTILSISDPWDTEWNGVVENYWDKCNDATIARMCDPDMRGRSDQMVWYYLNIEEARRRTRDNARARYHKSSSGSLLKIKHKLRNHIARVCRLTKTGKTRKTIEYLGCDINAARLHIQKQFKKGMHWNNHGEVWEIDHIIPMSLFDLSKEDQRLRVNHFTNLRPEFKRYNREKGSRMRGSHQIALL
jgi:hypothetical protein